MRERFTRLNQEIAALESDRSPLSKDYATQLFKGTPWFLANLSQEKPSEVVLEEKTEAQVEVAKVPATEKVQLLQALEDFAKEKTSQGEKPYSFEGGEVHFVNKDGHQLLQFDEAPPVDLTQYENCLSSCSLCPPMALSKRGFVVSELSKKFELPLKVLFLGDYPKKTPDKKECFVGEGGDLLKKMIAAMKLSEGEYACSLSTKCFRSTEDQNVVDLMASNCLKNFYRELIVLKPQVVVALGTLAANLLLSSRERMAQIHGKAFTQKIIFKGDEHEFILIPTFHPDFLVSSPGNKKAAWEDLQKVMKIIGKI